MVIDTFFNNSGTEIALLPKFPVVIFVYFNMLIKVSVVTFVTFILSTKVCVLQGFYLSMVSATVYDIFLKIGRRNAGYWFDYFDEVRGCSEFLTLCVFEYRTNFSIFQQFHGCNFVYDMS